MSSADIAARLACQDLMIQSYRLVDNGRASGATELFTEDGRFAIAGSVRSLPLKADKSKLEFSGIVAMEGDSDETITVYGNADHLDVEGSRCGAIG